MISLVAASSGRLARSASGLINEPGACRSRTESDPVPGIAPKPARSQSRPPSAISASAGEGRPPFRLGLDTYDAASFEQVVIRADVGGRPDLPPLQQLAHQDGGVLDLAAPGAACSWPNRMWATNSLRRWSASVVASPSSAACISGEKTYVLVRP